MSFSSGDDYISCRDIADRLEELETEREDRYTEWWGEQKEERELPEEAEPGDEDKLLFDIIEAIHEDHSELESLKELTEELSNINSDWRDRPIVRDSYFEEHAKDYAEGMEKLLNHWPYNHIDWEAAAREHKDNYNSVEYDGETYWIEDY